MNDGNLVGHRHSKDDLPIGIGPGNIPDIPIMLAAIAAASAGTGLPKKPVATVATAPILLTGEQLVNGVMTSASRVGVTAQADGRENGIYVSSAGPWSRSTDADTDAEVTQGLFFFVLGGLYANYLFLLTTPDPITLGGTALAFTGLAPNIARVEKVVNAPLSPYTMAVVPGVDDTLIVDGSLGPVAVTLPPAAAFSPSAPEREIKLTGPGGPGGAGIFTARPGDFVDGAGGFTLVVPDESRILRSNGGVKWRMF